MTEAYHQLVAELSMVLAMLRDAVPAQCATAPPERLVKLNATARPAAGGPLRAPFSGTPCVWFHTWELPHVVNIFGMRYSGVTATADVGGDEWSTDPRWGQPVGGPARSGYSDAPMVLYDGTGALLVPTGDAYVNSTIQTCNLVDKSMVRAWQSGGVTRVEWIVPVGAPVFAMGQVLTRPDGDRELAPIGGAPIVLTTTDERHLGLRAEAYAARGRR